MPVIFRKQGSLSYSYDTWTAGAGSASGFGQNGNTGENQRVVDTDPWGGQDLVWETRASGDGGADGGWNADTISIDNTKLYRFSVWVRRTSSTGGGTFYFGTAGGGQCVIGVNNNTEQCNPYWNCSSPGSLTQNQWYLVVGHVFPYTYSSTDAHPDTGFWVTGQPTGTKVFGINTCNLGVDAKWGPSTTSTYHRTYHYYCGDSTTRLQFFQPRIDLCDGSQPTVQALLENKQNSLKSLSVFPEGGSLTHQRVNANGGTITEVGEWRIHRFNSSGTFTLFGYKGDKLEVDYLIVAGGGGGGMDMGGGGGGGGVLNSSTVIGPGTYTITVGGGGTGAPAGSTNGQPAYHQFTIGATQGGNSSALGYTATGGGYGASSYYGYTPNYGYPGNGGSGGGPSGYSDGGYRTGGTGISGQGRSGGNAGPQYYSGGGGGADLPGNGTNSAVRPDAGDGRLVTILGRPFYWGGGGGGASYSLSTGGYGGKGGGGGGALGTTYGGGSAIAVGSPGGGGSPGTWAQTPGGNGATNTGGGGGGGSHYNSNNKGGDGGSGIVIIRYKFK